MGWAGRRQARFHMGGIQRGPACRAFEKGRRAVLQALEPLLLKRGVLQALQQLLLKRGVLQALQQLLRIPTRGGSPGVRK